MLGSSGVRRRLPVAMQNRDFALLVLATLGTGLATPMIAVAIGWQVYDIHHRAFDLGLIGLLEFGPVFLLALPAGALTDRVSRKLMLAGAALLLAGISAALILVSESGARQLWPFLALAAGSGVAEALSFPAMRALPPLLVSREELPGALALESVVSQAGTVAGPALGGLLFAIHPEITYATALALFALAAIATLLISLHGRAPAPTHAVHPIRELLGGIHFIGATPMLLGAILLDLFAVLFGGAVALLPVFAQTILHVGPFGLGVLRSAPAAGAVIAGLLLIRAPLRTRAGPTLITMVVIFGASTVVFGLSHWFVLSLAALVVGGFVDMFSVNIRSTTATMITPNQVRGRVGSVEAVFIGASNQLGAFESGTAAALLGTVPSVVAGGAITIAIALSWTKLFPALAKLGRMSELEPADGGHPAEDLTEVPVPIPAGDLASATPWLTDETNGPTQP
ncbi:MAG TPA: MFS transporter [Solirubrobacteraceae bacterium]|jgi:MFS family permease